MRVKQEKENRLFEAKDWSDLFEYTSETDDDSSGCGSAGYDGRDGPRERGEEELMSPPMQPNGGGSDDTCALGSYFSYDNCLSYRGGNEEECDCICLNSGCDDDDDGLPEPPAGAECDVELFYVEGVPIGLEFWCNKDASEYIGDVCTYIGLGAAIGSVTGNPIPITIAISCAVVATQVATCKYVANAGIAYYYMIGSLPQGWCHTE
ncbi:MAG: hypothetical protein R6V04_05485 [bacterium]